MRICLQLLYTEGWVNLAKIVVPNIVNYCRKHGYNWNIHCFPEPCKFDFGYEKLKQIKNLFQTGLADVVWSLDCDAIITNYNKKVEDIIDPHFNFYITQGANTYNAGSFIIKKSKWTYLFIEDLLSKQGKENMHCEQDALCDYIREYGTKDICILPHPSINSFKYELYPEYPEVKTREEGNWHEGDWVLHLPGVGMDLRQEILSNVSIIL